MSVPAIPKGAYPPTKAIWEVDVAHRYRVDYVQETDDGNEYVPLCEFDTFDSAEKYACSLRTHKQLVVREVKATTVIKGIDITTKTLISIDKKPIITHVIDEENKTIQFTVNMNFTREKDHAEQINSSILSKFITLAGNQPYKLVIFRSVYTLEADDIYHLRTQEGLDW